MLCARTQHLKIVSQSLAEESFPNPFLTITLCAFFELLLRLFLKVLRWADCVAPLALTRFPAETQKENKRISLRIQNVVKSITVLCHFHTILCHFHFLLSNCSVLSRC